MATDAGIKTVSRRSSAEPGIAQFSVDMGVAKITRLDDGEAEVDMGNPHLVIVDESDSLDLAALGHQHQDLNVELVTTRGADITMRVWERGVGETLACGTGSCAVAAAMHAWGRTGDQVKVHQPGGTALVELTGDSAVLIGPSQHIADIEVASP